MRHMFFSLVVSCRAELLVEGNYAFEEILNSTTHGAPTG